MKRSLTLLAGIIALLLLTCAGCSEHYVTVEHGATPPEGYTLHAKGTTTDWYKANVCCGSLLKTKHYPAPKTATAIEPENTVDDKSTSVTDTGLNVRPEDLPTKETPVDSNDNAGQDSGGGGCGYD